MRKVLLVTLLASIPSLALAQTPAVPTTVDVLVIPPTGDPQTAAPIAGRATAISATSTNCNLPVTPGTENPNPTNPVTVGFDDPFNPGRQCNAPFPTGLNAGSYRVVALFTAPTCSTATPCPGPRSTQALPFSVAPVLTQPVRPTGLVIRPPA